MYFYTCLFTAEAEAPTYTTSTICPYTDETCQAHKGKGLAKRSQRRREARTERIYSQLTTQNIYVSRSNEMFAVQTKIRSTKKECFDIPPMIRIVQLTTLYLHGRKKHLIHWAVSDEQSVSLASNETNCIQRSNSFIVFCIVRNAGNVQREQTHPVKHRTPLPH